MGALARYRCDECGEIHDDQDAAIECCPPSVSRVFVCSECAEVFRNEEGACECCRCAEVFRNEEGAGDCCPDVVAETFHEPTPRELEAAGQQRLEL